MNLSKFTLCRKRAKRIVYLLFFHIFVQVLKNRLAVFDALLIVVLQAVARMFKHDISMIHTSFCQRRVQADRSLIRLHFVVGR